MMYSWLPHLSPLGDLTIDECPYLGKFTVERIYERLTNAEAAYWRRIYSGRPGAGTDLAGRRFSRGFCG